MSSNRVSLSTISTASGCACRHSNTRDHSSEAPSCAPHHGHHHRPAAQSYSSCAGTHHVHHAHSHEACSSCDEEAGPSCGHSSSQDRATTSSSNRRSLSEAASASALQAKVRKVMRSDLNVCEKQARIHAIFLAQRSATTKRPTTSDDLFPGVGARAGCQHYERKCWIRAECCAKYYPCRRCHDEAEDHEINRAEIKYIACVVCGDKEQPLSPTCRTCGVRFARYFCEPCKMYNDSADRDCFHCDKCGICRAGKAEDNYHCDDCGICMAKERRYDHPCRKQKNTLESNCPICHEHLATTTEEIYVLQCTHPIHAKCFDQYTRAGNYNCPLCSKAMFDQQVMQDWYRKIDQRIQLDEMPHEFRRKKSLVFCNDCETKTTAKLHFRFHKCKDCAGYNTTVLHQFDDYDDKHADVTNEEEYGARTPDMNAADDEGGGNTRGQDSPAQTDTINTTSTNENENNTNCDDGNHDSHERNR